MFRRVVVPHLVLCMVSAAVIPGSAAADSVFAAPTDEFWERTDLDYRTRTYAGDGLYVRTIGYHEGSSPITAACAPGDTAGEVGIMFTSTRSSALDGHWAGSDSSRTTYSNRLVRQGVMKFRAFDGTMGALNSVIVHHRLDATVREGLWLCDTTVGSDAEASNQGSSIFRAWVASLPSASGEYPDPIGRELYTVSAGTSSGWKKDYSCWYESWWSDITGFLASWVPDMIEFFMTDVRCSFTGLWESAGQVWDGPVDDVWGALDETVRYPLRWVADRCGIDGGADWDSVEQMFDDVSADGVEGIDTDCNDYSFDKDLEFTRGGNASTSASSEENGTLTLTAAEYYALLRRSEACTACDPTVPPMPGSACASTECLFASDGWIEIAYSQEDSHELRYESGDEKDKGSYTSEASGFFSVEYVYTRGPAPLPGITPIPVLPPPNIAPRI